MKPALAGAAAGFILGVVVMSGGRTAGAPAPTPRIVHATPQIIRETAPPPSVKVVEITPAPRDACLAGLAKLSKGATVLADTLVKVGETVIDDTLTDAEARITIATIIASADADAVREAASLDPQTFLDACR